MTKVNRRVRSALFVPGSRPERFEKALGTGADRIIIDFEDAVEESLKAHARENLRTFMSSHPAAQVAVRVNAVGHIEHSADVACCADLAGVVALMLPKAEGRGQVEQVAACGKPVWPLIESVAGALSVASIAAAKGVERLTFGALDLGLDIGAKAGSPAAGKIMDQLRYSLLFESVKHGLDKPLDTVFADIANLDGLRAMASFGRDLGLGGMLCIHPSQVAIANDGYSPTVEEIAWAMRVVEAAKRDPSGAFRLDGKMVDAPVVKQAYRVIEDQAGA